MRVLELIYGLGQGGAESAILGRLPHQPPGIHTELLLQRPADARTRERLEGLSVTAAVHPLVWTHRRWMLRHIADHGFDIVVSHSPRESLKLLAWRIDEHVPLVVVAHHEVASDRRFMARVQSAVFARVNRRASLHMAVSTSAAAGAQCRGSRRTVVHLLGGSHDPAGMPPTAWPDGTRIRLMTLSRLVWFKNLPALVSAVSLARGDMESQGAHVAIIGSGPMRDVIARSIAAERVQHLVSMRTATGTPGPLLAQAEAFISCSTSEGGPITLFEAAQAGGRLLATPTGAAPDVLAGDPGSVMARGPSPHELADALRQIIWLGPVDAATREERSRASQHWSSRVRAQDFYGCLRKVVNQTEG